MVLFVAVCVQVLCLVPPQRHTDLFAEYLFFSFFLIKQFKFLRSLSRREISLFLSPYSLISLPQQDIHK